MTESANPSNRDKPEPADFHTVKETACYLRLCKKQVRRLISRGEHRPIGLERELRIKKEHIDAYAEARRIHPV